MTPAPRFRVGRSVLLLLLLATLTACVDGGFGVADDGWGDDGYDEAPLGYDLGFVGPDAYDYGGWGPGYLVGPPAYGGGYGYGYGYGRRGDDDHRGDWGGHPGGPEHGGGGFGNGGGGFGNRGGGGFGNRGGGGGMYRPAPAGHPMPSIPRGGRGGGMRGGRR